MLKRIPVFAAVFIAVLIMSAGFAQAAGKQLARQMGVPVYPGSKYLESMGAYSQPGQKMYVFEAMDKPEKVTDWYKKRLKKQASKQKRGQGTVYIISLKGKSSPEDYIMVEPNIYSGKGLSIITVIRKIRK